MSHYSPLADVTVENFTHNNMVPFFGSKISQNVDDSRNEVLLENFTGACSPGGIGPKTEVASFSDVTKHMMPENVPHYASTMERLHGSVMRTSERPVEPERVGPGTKYDDLALPSGGFQQEAYRDAKFYPTVDELRTKTHPKTSFEARTIDGQKGANRAEDVGEFNKNRVDTFAEYGTDSMLPNAGISKNTTRSCMPMKETNRKVAHEYSGVPYQNKGDSKYGKIKESTRNQFSGFGSRNDSHQDTGRGQDEDYGRKSMRVYDNQRDLTSVNTFQGNLSTLIKSMIAPMSDVLKPTTKEYLVQNAREFGPINSTAIHKATVHDPNDVARTTIKETNIHDTRTGNLRSFEKITTYDPNDVARTTIKETNIHDTRTGPMSVKPASYAKNNDPTKTTVRETIGEYDKTVNLQGVARQTVYNPKEIARTTVKETTLGASALGGVGTMEDGSGYRTANMKAKATNKQITSDNYYSGNADASEADGYKTASMHAPVTSKQIVSDHEHFGMASSDTEAGRSYEDIYNAIMNTTREEMYAKPVPTTSGPKHTNGTETVNLTNLPLDQSGARTNQHVGKIYQNPLSKDAVNLTKDTLSLDGRENDRLNPDLLKAFRENPYTHSITSFA
jgi:hypothetical protein